jgi:putative phosphonate metabolism protein
MGYRTMEFIIEHAPPGITTEHQLFMRYAIYYAPPLASPLWHQGSRWLGRDALSGHSLQQPSFRDIEPDSLADLTRTPAHYGFHATLVPPFCLKEQLTEADLLRTLVDFSARQTPLSLPSLILSQIDNFFCLRPVHHSPALQKLASLCTREFDRFRAPLSPSEMARRKAAPLNGDEKKNLEIWGYPYVFEQFRFHFTLTGRMGEGKLTERVLAALFETFGLFLNKPLVIDALCLFVEPGFGQPLRCLHRFPFPLPSSEPEERVTYDQQLLHQNLYPGYQCHPA